MKVVHSCCLLLIGLYLARMTAQNQQLTDKHYKQILITTISLTLAFCVPIFFVIVTAYYSESTKGMVWDDSAGDYSFASNAVNKDSSHLTALLRFVDWMLMMVIRSDMGVWGFMATVLI